VKKFLVAIIAALAFAPATLAAGPTLYVENTSTVVTDAQIADALPAFQASVSQDLAPIWGADATLVQAPAPAGAWTITVSDNSDVNGALGYHWLADGVPYGKVFAVDSADDGANWQVVFTHELFEMLVDPYANRASLSKRFGKQHARWWLTEVGDPVESDDYAYTRPSATGQPVFISDFITPAWYDKSSTRYDFRGYVKRPTQLLPGGYANYWLNGRWNPVQLP
jgi:hypothetical protein